MIIGGNDGIKNVEVLGLDGEVDAYGDIDPYPLSITQAIGGRVGRKNVIVCGGLSQGIMAGYHNECYSLDLTSKLSWVRIASMNTARVDAASVEVNGTLWITGGQTGSAYLSSTEYYNQEENKWRKGPKLPERLIKHSMAVLDNDTVLITGGDT